MLKQLKAGIVSLGLISTMTAPVMAQNAFGTSTEADSIPTNDLLVEDYSNLYTNIPKIAGEQNTLAVKNTLDFSNININQEEDAVALEDFDLLAQRRTRNRSKYEYSAGLDLINFGWVRDNNGAISSVLGFNLGLGVGYRKYFQPTRDGRFNFSYTLGTVLLIVPLAGVGADYQWDSGWYVGAHAFFYPIFLFFDDFIWPVWPTVVGGYRWK